MNCSNCSFEMNSPTHDFWGHSCSNCGNFKQLYENLSEYGLNMSIIEEITELTSEWYKLIAGDHHKDRDCHWYIETKWSYGDSPVYLVCHYGYIIHNFKPIHCDSYDSALKELKKILQNSIQEERMFGNE